MEKYFVNQKKHNSQTDAWDNNAHTKDTQPEAMHQYFAFLSTYAYGYGANIDYVSCSVETIDGAIIISHVDDRLPKEEPSPEPQANA